MRIQSKEFLIVQHFGSGRDIPALAVGISESASTASLASVMSDSSMMESMLLQPHGLLLASLPLLFHTERRFQHCIL